MSERQLRARIAELEAYRLKYPDACPTFVHGWIRALGWALDGHRSHWLLLAAMAFGAVVALAGVWLW